MGALSGPQTAYCKYGASGVQSGCGNFFFFFSSTDYIQRELIRCWFVCRPVSIAHQLFIQIATFPSFQLNFLKQGTVIESLYFPHFRILKFAFFNVLQISINCH